jgi:hypothetical protein
MADNGDDAKFCKLCSSPFQQNAAKTCPSGRHTMDPSWTECAYCKADAAAGGGAPRAANPLPPRPQGTPPPGRQRTMVEGSPMGSTGSLPPRSGPTPPPGGANRVRTFVENDSPAAKPQGRPVPITYNENTPLPPRPDGRPAPPEQKSAINAIPPSRKTVYGTPLPSAPSVAKARKIVGVLVTYSWRPEGKVYEVREGRNLIGRDASCDICVPEDETLSGVNSHITFRQSFVIGDMVSMMGTDLDGVPIEQQFHSLNSYATIRAGSTHFTFIAVEPRGSFQQAEE